MLPIIDTDRLRLRQSVESDIPNLVAGLNDWAVAQWVSHPPFPYSADDARAFLERSLPPSPGAPPRTYAIADRQSDQLLGGIGLGPQEDAVELGYWLATPHHGRGYMREAVAALLKADGGRFPATPLIYATTDPENQRSQAVLIGAGFKRVAVLDRKRPSRRGSLRMMRFELRSF